MSWLSGQCATDPVGAALEIQRLRDFIMAIVNYVNDDKDNCNWNGLIALISNAEEAVVDSYKHGVPNGK